MPDSYDKANRFMGQIESRSPNGEDLAVFKTFCVEQGYSPNSIATYYKAECVLQTVSPGKKFRKVTADDIVAFMEELKKKAKPTQTSYRTSFKRLLKWMIDHGKGPEDEGILEGLDESEESKNWKPKRKANVRLPAYLNKEDLAAMQQAAPSLKYKVLLACLYATGARIGELLNANIGDVEIREERIEGKSQWKAKWTLRTSKTEPRGLPWVKEGVVELKEWLAIHPNRDNPEAPLFLNELGERLNYGNIDQIFRYRIKPAAEAILGRKLGKPGDKISLHTLRHSRATDLAQSLTPAQMAAFFGWSQTSQMMAVYINGAGVMPEDGLRHHYREPLEVTPEIAYAEVACPVCNYGNTEGSNFCSKCGAPLTEKAAGEVSQAEHRFAKMEARQTDALTSLFKLVTLQSQASLIGDSAEHKADTETAMKEVNEALNRLGVFSKSADDVGAATVDLPTVDLPTVKSAGVTTKLKPEYFEDDDGKPNEIKFRFYGDEMEVETFGKGRRPGQEAHAIMKEMEKSGVVIARTEKKSKTILLGKSKELAEKKLAKKIKELAKGGKLTKKTVVELANLYSIPEEEAVDLWWDQRHEKKKGKEVVL